MWARIKTRIKEEWNRGRKTPWWVWVLLFAVGGFIAYEKAVDPNSSYHKEERQKEADEAELVGQFYKDRKFWHEFNEYEQNLARTQAMRDAAFAYDKGDYATALRLYRSFADQGSEDAQYNLGVLYATGRGVPQDYAVALEWYRRAANQGSGDAQHNLGVLYATGRGVPQDDAVALAWFRKAADQGYAAAQYDLGVLYATGSGVPQDYAVALAWFRRAADQGYADAQYNLGVLHAKGQGVPQDYSVALEWYRKAADQGSGDAPARPRRSPAMPPAAVCHRTTPSPFCGIERRPTKAMPLPGTTSATCTPPAAVCRRTTS